MNDIFIFYSCSFSFSLPMIHSFFPSSPPSLYACFRVMWNGEMLVYWKIYIYIYIYAIQKMKIYYIHMYIINYKYLIMYVL